MPAYALAHLRTIRPHADILDYMERIQATLQPFGGRFLVHGDPVQVLEGGWPGQLVIIEFPTMRAAGDWYDSAAYQAILPSRLAHIDGDTLIVQGVGPDHDSAALAARVRAQWEGVEGGRPPTSGAGGSPSR